MTHNPKMGEEETPGPIVATAAYQTRHLAPSSGSSLTLADGSARRDSILCVRICPTRGEENSDRAKFCQNCGQPLAEAATPRETRKVVTVLFADVTGSTTLGEQLDPESLRNIMSRYFEAMAGVVERHGGVVEKFIGDAVMAVFGIPRLHEDDPIRAVRAAQEMQQALAG